MTWKRNSNLLGFQQFTGLRRNICGVSLICVDISGFFKDFFIHSSSTNLQEELDPLQKVYKELAVLKGKWPGFGRSYVQDVLVV